MDLKIEVCVAELSDKPVLRNLMELYIYDFSEFELWDVDAHGLFGYRYLDHYWTDVDRFPFLIRSNGQLAGFALLHRLEDGVMSIAEFFVLRRYRRAGVGRAAVATLLDRFTGEWEVSVIEGNVGGLGFWGSVLTPYAPSEEQTLQDGQQRSLFRFANRT